MLPVATLMSISDHGGHAITSSEDVTAEGQPVVRAMDLHTCPIPHHGVTPMQGTSQAQADGRPIVRQFVDQAGCGAVFITGANAVEAS
jgi:uncharacterized Zn-binding protein involved in type VI secretion